MITFAVIVIAYVLNIIPQRASHDSDCNNGGPEGLLSDLDIVLIHHLGPFTRFLTRYTEPRKQKYYETLQHFVLTLSDQQIVTGLSILCIGYYKHCTLYTYHFFIIIALGWFSSTTHLSTLTILQGYFTRSSWLKYIRLAGIVAVLILLFVGLLVLYTDYSFAVRVQCRLDKLSLPVTKSIESLCMILVLMYVVIINVYKSLQFCFGRRSPYSSATAILEHTLRGQNDRSPSRQDYYSQRLNKSTSAHPQSVITTLRAYLLTFNFAYLQLQDSFLWQLLWLLFNNLYGVRQIYWARSYVGHRISRPEVNNEDELGFGQLLALLLLALPVLAAVEAYQGT